MVLNSRHSSGNIYRSVQRNASHVDPTHIPWSGHSILLENHNRHPTRRIQSASAAMPHPGAATAHSDSARRRAGSVQRNQRGAGAHQSLFGEAQNRVQARNRLAPSAEHHRSASTQFLFDFEQTRQSGPILFVQVCVQAGRRHCRHARLFVSHRALCTSIGDTAMRRGAAQTSGPSAGRRSGRRCRPEFGCGGECGSHNGLHQTPWGVRWTAADADDTAGAAACDAVIHDAIGWVGWIIIFLVLGWMISVDVPQSTFDGACTLNSSPASATTSNRSTWTTITGRRLATYPSRPWCGICPSLYIPRRQCRFCNQLETIRWLLNRIML